MEANANVNTDMAMEENELDEYFMTAPIEQVATDMGISVDDVAQERVERAIEATLPKLEVNVRPIEPKGNLLGFASVKIGYMTVNDFKIVENKDGGLFVGMPSKPDKGSRSGYRNTTYVDKDFLDNFNAAVIGEYRAAIEKLQARAAAVSEKPRVAEQMAEAGKQAAEHNAAKPAPVKSGKAKSAEL